MSEIISLHLGGTGINIGLSFWKQFQQRLKIVQQNKQLYEEYLRTSHEDIFMRQSENGSKIPRALFLDNNHFSENKIAQSWLNIPQNNYLIQQKNDTRGIYARNMRNYFYSLKKDEPFIDLFRKQIQKCDHFRSIMITHSMSGGLGGSFLLYLPIFVSEKGQIKIKLLKYNDLVYDDEQQMSEIVSVFLGGCGTNIGVKFWQQFTENKQQLQDNSSNKQYENCHFSRFMSQGKNSNMIPRTVFIDTDDRYYNKYNISLQNLNISQQNCVYGNSSCQNNYGVGRYAKGQQITDSFMQIIRKQTQKCDCLSGFVIVSGTDGGVGSGVRSNLFQKLSEQYACSIVQDFCVYEGQYKGTLQLSPLSVYNTILGFHYAIEMTTICCNVQNNATLKILSNQRKKSTFQNLNEYFAQCLNSHIQPYFRAGTLNCSQRKRCVNLTAYPRIKMVCGSLSGSEQKDYLGSSFKRNNRLIQYSESVRSFIIGMNVNVQDSFTNQQQIMQKYQFYHANDTLKFIPNPVHLSLLPSVPKKRPKSWVLTNDLQNLSWLSKCEDSFTKLLIRKAFMHKYLQIGMDEMQFTEAESNINSIVSEYSPINYQNQNQNQFQSDQFDYYEQIQ